MSASGTTETSGCHDGGRTDGKSGAGNGHVLLNNIVCWIYFRVLSVVCPNKRREQTYGYERRYFYQFFRN